MNRSLIDRWTDTTAFRVVLFVSGCIAVPLLLLGLIGAAALLVAVVVGGNVDLDAVAFVLLSVGGALGLFGYFRAVQGEDDPERCAMTRTLLYLAIGIVTASFVAGFVAVAAAEDWLSSRGSDGWLPFATLIVVAHAAWVVAGVGRTQRLLRRYAEETGRFFDTVPVMMLFVALALATSAMLGLSTL